VSWLAPPNTNDSLAYHMPRVMHWIQDRSVAGYPTAIERQIWNPPGAEYIILHFTLLAGSDRLANFVQWGSLLGSLVAASLVAACLGAGRRGQWLAAWLVLTIPMAILQATSTQNDLATGFWVLATAAWIAQAAWRRSHQLTPLTGGEWGILGLTVGLGVLTKGTFYAFAAPLLVWLVVIVWRQGVLAVIRFGLSGVVLVVLLNAGIWTRNIQRYGQPLGQPGAVSTLANESFTPGAILSNLARNLGTQLATPIGPLNHVEVGALRLFHQVIGQNIDDPRTSLVPFRLQNELASEDFSGNPLHLLLVGVALLAFWPSGSAASRPVNNRDGPGKNRRTRIKVTIPGWYALGVVASFGLFSILYKWQPWGSRLLLPFFLLSAPLVARQFVHGLRPWVFPTLLSVTWLLGLIPLLANNARPVVLTGTPPVSVFTTSRSNLLFVNSPENQVAYGQLARWVPLAHCDQLALILNSYDIEYPLWAQLSPSGGALGNEVRIEHVDPEAPLAPIPGRLSGLRDEPPFQPCAVFISIYNYDTSRLPGFDLAESRLGFQLFLRKELMQYIR